MLGLTSRPSVAAVATRSQLTKSLVHRFVAGETLDQAIDVVRTVNAAGMGVALDPLGENTTTGEEASQAAEQVLLALERVYREKLQAYVSLKLTQLGLDVGEHLVIVNLERILNCAAEFGNFIRLDMEGSTYTARTIETFELLRARHDNVGIVLQAYLYRSMADARRLTQLGSSIRLCKGAYSEPPHIAFRRKRDTDRNFVRIMEYLLEHGHQPAIATHDSAIIDHACIYTKTRGISADRFEFQMLYGVRRDLQEMLVDRGYRVRVYVPYGTQWYAYLTRRLAERPANLLSMAGSLVRETRRVRRPDSEAVIGATGANHGSS
jgi:proline dehydrogenase